MLSKADPAVFHLVILLALIAAAVIIIVTGHDDSPLVHQLLGAAFGGALGGSVAGSLPLLTKGAASAAVGQPPADPPSFSGKQGGFTRLQFLLVLVAWVGIGGTLAACSTLGIGAPSTTAPVDAVASSCASASAAIKTLTVAKQAGQLSAATTTNVNAAIAAIAPVCSAPVEPSTAAASLTIVSNALVTLEAQAAKVPAAR